MPRKKTDTETVKKAPRKSRSVNIVISNETIKDNVVQKVVDETIKDNVIEETIKDNVAETVVEETIKDNVVETTNNNNTVEAIIEGHVKHQITYQEYINILDYIPTYDEDNEWIDNSPYTLNDKQLNNILQNIPIESVPKPSTTLQKFSLKELKQIFNKFTEAIILVQIINGEIKFIEKKGYESRNQSVIDLLIKANNYKKIPDVQFLISTSDFIINPQLYKYPYLLTFCKNHNYNTNLFPNFNFNHWKEANIGNYEDVYNKFITNEIQWTEKEDIIYWAGSNTNIIRKKIYDSTLKNNKFNINLSGKYLPITEHNKYKYLLNMDGKSYAGRLNYLYLTGSCIIILKNEDANKCYDEFFYNYFIKDEDYIEILYNDRENALNIIKRIQDSIATKKCDEIAKRCFNKAKELFKMNNIYQYINDVLSNVTHNLSIDTYLENTISYLPAKNDFFKNRLNINGHEVNFYFKGKDMDLRINENMLINISNDKTHVLYDNKLLLVKYTPLILNDSKQQHYKIIVNNNKLNIIVENKFNLINFNIPEEYGVTGLLQIDIKSDNGGWLIIHQ